MKKYLFNCISTLLLLCSFTFVVTSCSNDDDDAESQTFSALFTKTDHFIDMLDTIYEKYDAFGSKAADTSDGKYVEHHEHAPAPRPFFKPGVDSPQDVAARNFEAAMNREVTEMRRGY